MSSPYTRATEQQLRNLTQNVVIKGDILNRPNLKISVLRKTIDDLVTLMETMTRAQVQKVYNRNKNIILEYLLTPQAQPPFNPNLDLDQRVIDSMVMFYAARYVIAKIRIPLQRITPTLNPESEPDWELY